MQPVTRFRRYSNDQVARWVVYFSPYFFWAVIAIASVGVWLFVG
jgi:hypothetical protein